MTLMDLTGKTLYSGSQEVQKAYLGSEAFYGLVADVAPRWYDTSQTNLILNEFDYQPGGNKPGLVTNWDGNGTSAQYSDINGTYTSNGIMTNFPDKVWPYYYTSGRTLNNIYYPSEYFDTGSVAKEDAWAYEWTFSNKPLTYPGPMKISLFTTRIDNITLHLYRDLSRSEYSYFLEAEFPSAYSSSDRGLKQFDLSISGATELIHLTLAKTGGTNYGYLYLYVNNKLLMEVFSDDYTGLAHTGVYSRLNPGDDTYTNTSHVMENYDSEVELYESALYVNKGVAELDHAALVSTNHQRVINKY